MKRKLLLLITMVAVVCWAGTAGATTTYVLNLQNADANYQNPAPFGEVTVDLVNSTTASLTYTTLAPSPLSVANDSNDAIPSYTFANKIGASVNGNFSVSNIKGFTETGASAVGPFTWDSTPNTGDQTFDGFGLFDLVINVPNAGTSDADIITFTLANTSGSWASDADVLALNALNGYHVAAHEGADFTLPGQTLSNTFYATDSPVPVPGALLLLGLGLVRLGVYGRKKRQAAA